MVRVCFNLTFDETTEQGTRSLWQRIEDAGIAVRGMAGYRPHISLACYDVPDIAAYETGIAAVATATPPFSIRLDSMGIFPEAGVLFLAPRMSHTLLRLVRAVFRAFDRPGKAPVVDDEYLPHLSMPHCTLPLRLAPDKMLAAVDTCQRDWAPIRGQATGIGMRLLPTPVDHCHYPLRQHADA